MFPQSAGARDEDSKASRRSKGCRYRPVAGLLFAVVFVGALDPGQPAQAYLDPGTGAIILQMLLGGVAGALVILKLYWHRFTSFFRRGRKDPEAAAPPPRK
jgi:hypothetical protein